jgi:hypothetical protein
MKKETTTSNKTCLIVQWTLQKILLSYLLKYPISEMNTEVHKIFNKQRNSLGIYARVSYGLKDPGFKFRQIQEIFSPPKRPEGL